MMVQDEKLKVFVDSFLSKSADVFKEIQFIFFSIDIVAYLVKEASNSWTPPVSYVKVLTSANFTEWVENQDLALVEFYSPGYIYFIWEFEQYISISAFWYFSFDSGISQI